MEQNQPRPGLARLFERERHQPFQVAQVSGDQNYGRMRPAAITLKYRDEHFAERTGEFSGMIARVLQHEIDHLDGTLFVDRMDKRDRKKIQKELAALASGIVDTEYPVVAREVVPISKPT